MGEPVCARSCASTRGALLATVSAPTRLRRRLRICGLQLNVAGKVQPVRMNEGPAPELGNLNANFGHVSGESSSDDLHLEDHEAIGLGRRRVELRQILSESLSAHATGAHSRIVKNLNPGLIVTTSSSANRVVWPRTFWPRSK